MSTIYICTPNDEFQIALPFIMHFLWYYYNEHFCGHVVLAIVWDFVWSFSKYCQTAKDGYDVNIHELKAHKIPENIHKEKNNCLKH